MKLISVLLLLTAPASAGTIAYDGDILYEWDGERLSRDGTDLGTMPWVQDSAAMAFLDRDLYVIHGDDACVLLLDVIPQPASDINASGVVDDTDLNLLLSGGFTTPDIDRLLRAFGFRFGTAPREWVDVAPSYREPDGYPRPFCNPVAAHFRGDQLIVQDWRGNLLDVDTETGEVVYIGVDPQPIGVQAGLVWDLDDDGDVDDTDLNIVLSLPHTPEELAEMYLSVMRDFGMIEDETQPIPEPSGLLLLAVGILLLQKRRRR